MWYGEKGIFSRCSRSDIFEFDDAGVGAMLGVQYCAGISREGVSICMVGEVCIM